MRWFLPENVFQPGDFIRLSHVTRLLNKITTPKGSKGPSLCVVCLSDVMCEGF